MTGGNIFHGEMSPGQLFFLRPLAGWAKYRTPIHNLYLCGSEAHPGGGVTGAPGRNAAREILSDWRRGRMRGRTLLSGYWQVAKKLQFSVTPAKAGVQNVLKRLDSGACPGPDPGFAGMTT